MLTRRALSKGGAALLGTYGAPTLLAGCDRSTEPTLRILGEDSSNLKAIVGVLPEFSKEYGIKITAEAADFSTALNKSTTDFSNGTGLYDIVLQYNFSLSPFVRNDYVYDVEQLRRAAPDVSFDFASNLLPNVWKELGYYAVSPFTDFTKSKPIAYPFAANTMILIYNRQILSDPRVAEAYQRQFGKPFSPPKTWQELAVVARLVRDANPKFSGIVLQGAAEGWLYYEWVNFLFGIGGRVMDKEFGWQSDLHTPIRLESSETSEAAQLYLSLKSVNAGDFFSVDAVKQRDIMLEGNTAFSVSWTDYVPDLAGTDGEIFGFAPVPGSRSMIAGGCFFVNRKSRSPAAAARLISYLLSASKQRKLALAGLFPPTETALNDSAVLSKPYMRAVQESVRRGVYMAEAGPDADLISQEITNTLQRAWKGEIAASDVGTEATRAIEQGRKKL